jgi:hypothetical protein
MLQVWRNDKCQKIRRYTHTRTYNLSFVAFTDEDVAAQAITFFGDGFETSSSALGFLLYSLATNPEVQDRVREEVTSVLKRHGDKLTFDSLQEMTYLDMVFAGMLHVFVGNVTYKNNFSHMSVLTSKQITEAENVMLKSNTKFYAYLKIIHVPCGKTSHDKYSNNCTIIIYNNIPTCGNLPTCNRGLFAIR